MLITAYCRPKEFKHLIDDALGFASNLYLFLDNSSGKESTETQRDIYECGEIAKMVAEEYPNVFVSRTSKNLGCYKAVTCALDWFFQHEDAGLILEDDLVVGSEIGSLAENLLSIQRNNFRIGSISFYRNYMYDLQVETKGKFVLSPFFSSWGWATWSDRWRLFRHNLLETHWTLRYMKYINKGGLDGLRNWADVERRLSRNDLDSWAYRWMITHWLEEMDSLIVPYNLVENIGFNQRATHTKSGKSNVIATMRQINPTNLPVVKIHPRTKMEILRAVYGVNQISTLARKFTRKLIKSLYVNHDR